MAAVPATPPVSYFNILPYELIDIIIKVKAQHKVHAGATGEYILAPA